VSLKYGVLGLLASEPLHGYDLKSRFEELLGGTWEVNIGQIYTTLQRLERDRLVEGDATRGDRGRRAYRLTEGGAKALNDWLEQPEAEPQQLREEIYVKLLLLDRRGDGGVASVLAKQRKVFLQRLKDLATMERRAREQARGDLVLLIKGAILHTEADLKWIDVYGEELEERRTRGGKAS
jgi:DNA-binding PadR family transcriptional regulator